MTQPIQSYASPPNPRLDLLEPRPGEHVWVAMAVFRISAESAVAATTGTGTPWLDRENLATIQLGCYVCEQTYEPRLVHRRCPGEPR